MKRIILILFLILVYNPAYAGFIYGGAADTAAIALNTTHRGSVGTDHSDVGLNNTHRTSDGKNHSDVVTNNAKVTNVPTALSVGTNTTTVLAITSDGGADDVTIPLASTTLTGVINSATFDAIGLNTAKATNVPTALSTGTVNGTSYGITSDGGTDDVVLAQADTTNAGVLSAAKWDEIVANTAKTGVTTEISNVVEDATPQLGGQLDVNSNAIGDGTLELLTFTETALAVNNINITNATTGEAPILSTVGDDTNISLKLASKGIGNVRIDKTLPATATQELDGLKIVVDSSAQDATSIFHALEVSTTGTPAGELTAIGIIGNVSPIHQHVTTLATPSQTEFAGLKSGGGVTWADGIDGVEIFVVANDAIFVGGAAQFDEIEVIMGTAATKNCKPTFWYNTAADSWTEFFPSDGTNGFQQSGNISWSVASITATWTGDSDPGGADTTAGYWIKVVRTRVADPGTPTPTTIKIGAATEYEWDETGDISVKNLGATTYGSDGSITDAELLAIDDLPTVYAKTSTAALVAAEVSGGNTLTNDGAGGEVILTWLTRANGQEATFYVNDAQYLQIKADSGGKIRIGAVQTAVNGYVRSNVVGNWITIKAMPDELVVMGSGGTWNYDE